MEGTDLFRGNGTGARFRLQNGSAGLWLLRDGAALGQTTEVNAWDPHANVLDSIKDVMGGVVLLEEEELVDWM
jgi:hypothetical protein